MALVLGVLDNYVVEDYLENQNLYVLGPAASAVTISVAGETYRFVEGIVTQEASFSWTATADPILATTVFAESQSTITVSIGTTVTAQLAVSAADTLALIDNGLALTTATATIATDQYKFAPSSFQITNTNSTSNGGILIAKTNMPAYGTGDMTLEGWFRADDTTWDQTIFDLRDGTFGDSTGGYTAFVRSNNTLRFQRGNSALHTTAALTPATWYHWAMVRSSGTINFYLNATRTFTGTDANTWPAKPVYLGTNGGFDAGLSGYLDEIRLSDTARYSGTTLTEPTAEFAIDANTDLLLHGNSLVAADAPITYFGVLRQTTTTGASEFAVSTQGGLLPGGVISAASECTQDTMATVVIEAQITLAGVLDSTCDIIAQRGSDIPVVMSFACTIVPDLTQTTEISSTSESTVAVDGDIFDFAEAEFTAAFDQQVTGTVILSTVTIAAQAQVTTEIEGSKGVVSFNSSNMQVSTSQTALGNQIHSFGSEVEEYTWDSTEPFWDTWPREHWGQENRVLFDSFDWTAQGVGVFAIAATVSSNFNTQIGSENIKSTTIDMTASATQSITGQVTHQAQAVMPVITDLDVDLAFVILGAVSMNVVAQSTITAEYTAGIQLELTAQTSLTALGGQDGSFEATFTAVADQALFAAVEKTFQSQMSAEFAATITTQTEQPAIVMLASLGEITINTGVTKTFAGNFASTFTQDCFGRLTNSPDIVLQAFYAQITIGQEMQSDPYRQIEVPCENRTLCVLKETRRLEVPCENRINRVAQPPWNEALYRRVA
jgi:hypothetical protein